MCYTYTYNSDGNIAGTGGTTNPSFCFVAGTTVLTTLGRKTIETIQVGDTVPCVDHITGEYAEKKVVSTTVNKVDKLIELSINGETIQCTDIHPFQVKDKGWVKAEDLRVGDLVYTKEWNIATVERVHTITLGEPIEVYNFEVEDCHTYYVGDGLWLVHNGPCKGAQTMSVDDLTPTHKTTMGRNKFRKFLEQVKQNGITEPIDYVPYKGKNFVVNGHHRLKAAKILGIDQVPVNQVSLPFKSYLNVTDLFFGG